MRLVAICAVLSACALAQESKFESRAQVVLIPVRVTDRSGHVVDGLAPADFEVLDNGARQNATVDTIATGVAPIALAVVVQAAGISEPVLAKVRRTGALIQPLIVGANGCAAVISFADQVKVAQECTRSTDAIELAFRRLTSGAQSEARLIDAVEAGVRQLRKMQDSRRVLLLISESKDRGSESDLKTAVMDAQRAGVAVYAATYSAFQTAFTSKEAPRAAGPRNPVTPVPNPSGTQDGTPAGPTNPRIISPENSMDANAAVGELLRLGKTNTTKALVNATGGGTLPFLTRKGLEEALHELGSELHSEYVLSFVPQSGEPGYHRLEVRVRGEYRVRARPGYWLGGDAR